MLTKIILASLLEMTVAFVGLLFFFKNSDRLLKHTNIMLSLAVGAFLGVVFLDLLPEAVEMVGDSAFIYVLVGFLGFLILSRTLFWYHHHHNQSEGSHEAHPHPRGPMVLIGDAVHNFIDGALIAFSFMADPTLGIVTTLAVLLHEFPQEIADFFVLISSGYSKKRALTLNVLSSSTTLVGALLAYAVGTGFQGIIGPALAITAGNFIYIAASDILPGLSSDGKSRNKTLKQILAILIGIFIIFFAIKLSGHSHSDEDVHHESETAEYHLGDGHLDEDSDH